MNTASLTSKNDRKELTGANNTAPFFKPVIQAKLSINEPGDHYEQEADAMADKVMRMTAPAIGANLFFKPANNIIQRKCQACEEEEKHVHRKENNTGEVAGSHELNNYVSSLSSAGQPMPIASRSFFETRFGLDFSNVRLHTDTVAAKSAQSINALAYTTGNNIVFNSGQYSPESDTGKKLIAHELTHVAQQSSTVQPKLIQRQEAQADPTTSSSCHIHFVQGRAEFTDAREFADCMARIRTYLAGAGDRHIILHGYASTEGTDAFNMDLSRRRGEIILTLLRSAHIDTSRIAVVPHGEDNTFPTLGENRRVEVLMQENMTFPPENVVVPRPVPPTPVPPTPPPAPAPPAPTQAPIYDHNTELGGLSVGNFDFHFDHCRILVWVWVKFQFEAGIPAADQTAFKTRFFDSIENKWGHSGYSLSGNSSCLCHNVPIVIHAQEATSSFYHKLVDVELAARRESVISDMNLSMATTDDTIAHEFGHVLGLYDEYDGGFFENRAFWHDNSHQSDTNAIMNSGTELRDRYFEHYRNRVQEGGAPGCVYSVSGPPP